MGYQALLFCPDEKTARTVTQVLSELDFAVVPCTEPFAAVKKLMGDHFDAVVVDCDNEQNATLLFKSARNAPNNLSALAVAVVEGQAGVAKAFRIGANLVLTKPINVEQAKGTLRVARGLLRKSEAARPATAAVSPAMKPAAFVAATPKPGPQATNPSVTAARPVAPIAPLVAATASGSTGASIATQKSAPQPKAVVSVPKEITEADTGLFEAGEEVASPPIAKRSAGSGTGAASAPAPARDPKSSDPKSSVSPADKRSRIIAEPETRVDKVAASGSSLSGEEISAAAPSLTFGGTVDGGESAGGGSRKALLAVAAVVLIVAGGYIAWTQFGHSNGPASVPVHTAAQPVTTPAPVPQAPRAVPGGTSFGPSSTTSSARTSAPDSASARPPTGTTRTSSDRQTAASEENASHPSKATAGADTSKPAASTLAANTVPATKAAAQPIVIKSGVSRPAGKSAAMADAPAPSLAGIAPAGTVGSLPNLMGSEGKAPTPVYQRLNVSQGVSRGLLVKRVQPTYPASAMRTHVEGSVQLMATVSKNGDISAVKIVSGDPQLTQSAVDAVRQWKYKPYLLNGEPVEIQTDITVNFKLPH